MFRASHALLWKAAKMRRIGHYSEKHTWSLRSSLRIPGLVELDQEGLSKAREVLVAEWELRPLSLGEILDRTFSLYRRNFLLFVGIMAIPQLLILVLNVGQVLLSSHPRRLAGLSTHHAQELSSSSLTTFGTLGVIVAIVFYLVAYLFAQGGTIYAVSDLYLGRTTTIGESLGRMWGHLLKLLGVSLLNGLAVLVAMIALIIPGIWLACRLSTCVPAALLENLGTRESLERSFALTKDNAGRALLIGMLYAVMLYALMFLFAIPFGVAVVMSARNPEMLRFSLTLLQVGNFCAGVLVGPFILIATSVFYYDLRVRKEAFDLQMMMNSAPSNPAADMRPRPLQL